MTITKELLSAQLVQAVQTRDEHMAKMNAAIGAINMLNHLLAAAELPEPAAAPPAPPERDPVA